MECLCAGPGWCVFLLTAPVLCLYGWVALWESIMHPFQHLKIMCTAAAEALDKQGNMSLIKISFISLLIKRLCLVIECLCPSPLGLSFLYCIFCCFFFFLFPSLLRKTKQGGGFFVFWTVSLSKIINACKRVKSCEITCIYHTIHVSVIFLCDEKNWPTVVGYACWPASNNPCDVGVKTKICDLSILIFSLFD